MTSASLIRVARRGSVPFCQRCAVRSSTSISSASLTGQRITSDSRAEHDRAYESILALGAALDALSRVLEEK